jgi:hypothetical protein
MERVAFLIERTGERLGCMLNPDSVVMRRLAGVRARQSTSGPLTGAQLKDDPLLYTGGGRSELILDLLFDVSLAGSSISTEDVRDLTRPLAELAEGVAGEDGYTQPPVVRFVWGKHWNILGVIAAVAERLEYFTPEGAPQRSWLRMRLVRVTESSEASTDSASQAPIPELPEDLEIPPEQLGVHEVVGGGPSGITEEEVETEGPEEEPESSTERLDEIAQRLYGDCRFWRLIAKFNEIDNPLEVEVGRLLRIPPRSLMGGGTA